MMKKQHLRTSDISKVAGVHPNTVRLYEEWGFIPPVSRSANGYRQFTEKHLEHMQLARLVMEDPFPGRRIRKSGLAVVRQAAGGDIPGAKALAGEHIALVRAELKQAQVAADHLEDWVSDNMNQGNEMAILSTSQAAAVLDVTVDTLRHWERNGLITIPRHPVNGYRLYGPQEIGRLRLIRLLTRSGYSTMAVLRLAKQLEEGRKHNLLQVLDTPGPEEEIFYAADRWLSTLAEQERRALEMIEHLEKIEKGGGDSSMRNA